MPHIKAAIFDAYGTLLDVHSAMGRHAGRIGPDWRRLSDLWRVKQIEYTWVRSLAGSGHHRDFAALTAAALRFVVDSQGGVDAHLFDDLLRAYRSLSAYPEVPAMLASLKARGVARAILSNGTPDMLADATNAAEISGLLDDVLSVESVGVFKPDPRVYQLAADRFRCAPDEMAFLSSNPWDAFGAHCFGFNVFWVNRKRQPDEYNLRGNVVEIPDLATLPSLLT